MELNPLFLNCLAAGLMLFAGSWVLATEIHAKARYSFEMRTRLLEIRRGKYGSR